MERSAQPSDVWESADPPLALAQDQLAWYARNKRTARIGHYTIEVSQLVAAAGTTLAAATSAPPVVTAALASLTLLLTGLRQVFGFREKWATRAWAAIRIEHEIHLYRLHPADERGAAGRRLVLQVDAIVAEETHGWAEQLRAPGGAPPGPPSAVA